MNILKILTPKRIIGNFGERQAAKLLRKKGYKILEQNFTANNAEIDIIARRDGITAFVEVKTRTVNSDMYSDYGTPASAVTISKQKRLITAARSYLSKNKKYFKKQPRMDIIEVYLSNETGKPLKINHFEDAFGE